MTEVYWNALRLVGAEQADGDSVLSEGTLKCW